MKFFTRVTKLKGFHHEDLHLPFLDSASAFHGPCPVTDLPFEPPLPREAGHECSVFVENERLALVGRLLALKCADAGHVAL